MKSALILDDDEKLCALLMEYFDKYQIQLEAIHDPKFLLSQLPKYHLLILDVMLPGKTGFEICREVRQGFDIPIIMLTARGDVADKVVGFEAGADDYLSKPFEPRELVARVEALFRRGQARPRASEIKYFQGIQIDDQRRKVFVQDEEKKLTGAEFEILSILTNEPGMVKSREQILEKLPEHSWDPLSRSVDVLLSRLRNKIEPDPKNPTFIQTVRGVGYVFTGDNDA